MSPVPPPGTDTSGSIYQDGVFSRITAIHFPPKFAEGLAVEFEDNQSFTIFGAGVGNMNPGTVAFWVRIPQASVDDYAAKYANVPGFSAFRVFLGAFPIIAWGPQQSGSLQESSDTISGPMPPSYIGIRCAFAENTPILEVNLICGSATADGVGFEHPPFLSQAPEYFGNGDIAVTDSSPGRPQISTDTWHHVLVSWTINSDSNPGGSSSMHCLVDGVGVSKLPCMTPADSSPNAMVGSIINNVGADDRWVANQTGGKMASDPIVIPSMNPYSSADGDVDAFEIIQVADLYVYAGQMLTSAQPFITNGKPAKASDVVQIMGPASLIISGRSNWRNPAGADNIGMAGGKIVGHGKIVDYVPEPSLGS
jgi:hypothetical protein